MRMSFYRAVLMRTVSHRAMVTSLAGGVDPKSAFWHRKFARSKPTVKAR